VSKCIHCGNVLPPTGGCPSCEQADFEPTSLHEAPWAQQPKPPLPKAPARTVSQPSFRRAPPTFVEPDPEFDAEGAVDKTESSYNPSKLSGGAGVVHATVAPLWRRVLALLIDVTLVVLTVMLFFAIALAIARIKVPDTSSTGLDRAMIYAHAWWPVLLPAIALGFILALVYSAVLSLVWDGRTIGRRALGLKLVDASGLAPSTPRVVVRSILSAFSVLLFLGGYWLALFDRRRQTLHDKLAATFVVRPTAS
jgi:resuscitation-promoting factor RpfA